LPVIPTEQIDIMEFHFSAATVLPGYPQQFAVQFHVNELGEGHAPARLRHPMQQYTAIEKYKQKSQPNVIAVTKSFRKVELPRGTKANSSVYGT
jgi:hypothetical protein